MVQADKKGCLKPLKSVKVNKLLGLLYDHLTIRMRLKCEMDQDRHFIALDLKLLEESPNTGL